MLEMLLTHQDINVDAATFACQTALQLALGRKRFDLADLLRAHGGSWSDATRDSTSDSYSDDEMVSSKQSFISLCFGGVKSYPFVTPKTDWSNQSFSNFI